jgi:hypothetical protein
MAKSPCGWLWVWQHKIEQKNTSSPFWNTLTDPFWDHHVLCMFIDLSSCLLVVLHLKYCGQVYCDRWWSVFCFGSIFWCSQTGNDPQEDLAKFSWKINMKLFYNKHPLNLNWLDNSLNRISFKACLWVITIGCSFCRLIFNDLSHNCF